MPPPRRPLSGPVITARRRFLPPSSPTCSVRTLTIGVLIVTTGTLAALPFRNRTPNGPGEQPTRPPVSGPSGELVAEDWPDRRSESLPGPAPLSPSAGHPPETPTSIRPSDRGTFGRNGATANDHDGRDRSPERLAGNSQRNGVLPAPFPSGPNGSSAASYEEWMIPVDDSQLIRERFAATVSGSDRHDSGASGDRRGGATTPHSTDALPASLREARHHGNGTSFSSGDEGSRDDASTSDPRSTTGSISSGTALLPRRPPKGPAPPTSERHWIRQPR